MKKVTAIAVRVRRTLVEEIHVIVPVTDDVMDLSDPNQPTLDVKGVFNKACNMARAAGDWRWESETIEPHPLQTPMPTND